MRRRVPTMRDCEETITRESRYWTRAFRGLLSVSDVRQEAFVVALTVLAAFDPERNVKISTLLTIALRRHFRRLVKHVLSRAFLYSGQRAELRAHVALDARVNPFGVINARLMLERLRALPRADQELARALVTHDGRIRAVALHYRWSLATTHKRVAA